MRALLPELPVLDSWFASGSGGQARGLRGDRGLALLWLILGENSLLPVSKLVFSGHSCGQEVPGSWWVSPQGIQGTFFKGTWQMVLQEVNPGVCMRQKSRQSRLFRNVYVLGQLWLFTGKINQELKYFFFPVHLLCKRVQLALITDWITAAGNLDISLGAQLMRDVAPCWIFWSESLRLFWTVNNLNEKVWSLSGHWTKNVLRCYLTVYLTDDQFWWVKWKESANFMQMNKKKKKMKRKVSISERCFWLLFNSKLV